MEKNIMIEMEKKIHELMNDNHIMGEIVDERPEINIVAVEVIWGDWKHEHLKLDYLMKENYPNLRSICTSTTEEDGSDCYSAIHYYYFN